MNAIAASFARYAAIIAGLGLLFSWFGVYDTGQLSFPTSFAFWCLTITIGVVSSRYVMPEVFVRRFANTHLIVRIVIAAIAVSVPVTIALLLIHQFFFGENIGPADWPLQFLYVLVVSLVITAVFAFFEYAQQSNATSAGDQSGPGTPAIIDRLPARLRTASIYAVSAEDHYLRVHTSAGEELILMRLSDAIRELDGIEGLQTHRSWWVARDGLADAHRDNGKLVLKLKSGAEAPVSRTYSQSVRSAGWV